MQPLDTLRSIVRALGDRAAQRIERANPLPKIRERLGSFGRVLILDDNALTRAAAHADGIQQASLHCVDDKILVDLILSDGREVHGSLQPMRAAFAPRGAKELIFAVNPPEAAQFLSPVTAAISKSIAHLLWPMRKDANRDLPIVDREANGQLRVDLTTLPWLRLLLQQSSYAWLIEMISVAAIEVHPQELHLRLRFPIFA